MTLGIRPEHITYGALAGQHSFEGTVDVSEMMGSEIHLHINAGGRDVVLRVPTAELADEERNSMCYGAKVRFAFRSDLIHLFDRETGMNLLPAVDET